MTSLNAESGLSGIARGKERFKTSQYRVLAKEGREEVARDFFAEIRRDLEGAGGEYYESVSKLFGDLPWTPLIVRRESPKRVKDSLVKGEDPPSIQ